MNKKIIRVCQAAVLLLVCLALCSCTFFNALTAYGLYSQAAKKLEKAGGYEADCVMTMSFDILGEEISTSIPMNVKQNGDDVQSTTEVSGEKVVSTRIGDTVYVEYDGAGIKYHVSEQNDESTDEILGNAELPQLSKEVFENIEIVNGENGSKSISIELDGDTAKQLLGSFLGESEALTLDNIAFEMVFDKKNNIENMKITCLATIEVMGVSTSGEVSADYTFINFGQAPEITLNYPESEYEDGGEYQG